MIIYSIIIPHKNTPELLQKCIDSIPLRSDVQVIVVDDNSDPEKVDFDNFPHWRGGHYEILFTKEGKGAGYARNVGLEHALGRWIIFADADDFFLPDFERALSDYEHSSSEIIFFKCDMLSSAGVKDCVISEYVDIAQMTGSFSKLKFWMTVPWAKFFQLDFLRKNDIRFEEIRWSNDVVFATKAGIFAKEVECSPLYVYRSDRVNRGLTKANTLQSNVVRFGADCRSYDLLKEHALFSEVKEVSSYTLKYWTNILLMDFRTAFKLIPTICRIFGMRALLKEINQNKKRILRNVLSQL